MFSFTNRILNSILFLPKQPPFYSRNTSEMYNNILNKAPVLKPNVSNAGREILEGLLQKDRTKRLGAKEDFVSLLSCTMLTLACDNAHLGRLWVDSYSYKEPSFIRFGSKVTSFRG